MNAILTLIRGYAIKNIKRILIMIFAIAISTAIIFGTMVARVSQSVYTSNEIYKQSPSYQIEVANISKKDFDTIVKDDTVKDCILKKYYGIFYNNEKLHILESYNNQAFKKEKHTISSGRFPNQKNEIIVSDNFFKSLKSQKKLKLINDKPNNIEYEVDLSYSKEYIDKLDEHEIFNQTQKFKIVGTYKMTNLMEQFSEGDYIYVFGDFEYPIEAISYSGFIDLKSGFKDVQNKIDEFSLKLESGELNLEINKPLSSAKEDIQNALSSFNLFDTGTIIAAACIIFNVFNIMMKEIIKDIGLLRVVGMSKKQSLGIFTINNVLLLIIGSLIGFLGGYILAGEMIKYFSMTNVSIDASNAPIYISSTIIIKTLKVTISMLIVSTVVPIITIMKSYPVNMLQGKLRSTFIIFDEIFYKIKFYKKLKILISNIIKKTKTKTKFKFKKIELNLNSSSVLAINNSKRNIVYILTTAIIVGMAGLYAVQRYITTQNFSDIGDQRIQSLGNYDIQLDYTGISHYKDVGISQKEMSKISSIQGIKDICTYSQTIGYTKLNKGNLSQQYKKNLSITDEEKDIEMKFEVIGLNKDALGSMNNEYKNLIESGDLYDRGESDEDIVQAVVYNKFLDQKYSDEQKTYSEELKLGDILTFKVLTDDNGELKYKTVKIKIVGFFSEEWFTRGIFTKAKTPDIVIDSNEYAKMTGNSNFSQVKIKSNESQLEDVKNKVQDIVKDKENLTYNDRITINNGNNGSIYEVIIRDVSNSAILTLTASINIIFSMIASISMRKREFGILRSIGLSVKDLKKILIKEGIVYGLVSSFVGVVFILHKGLSWANLLRMTAKYQGVTYEGPIIILSIIPTLIFILLTMFISIMSVIFSFRSLNKYSIVEQIKED